MKKRVLVVDDNENNLLLEKDLLETEGFEVLEAKDAAGAMAIARREKPDIIVMDVRLPDMLGTEAIRILRQEMGTRDIPVVFVTSSVLAEGREAVSTISNSIFLGKPIDTRTFAKDISKFIK